MNIETSTTSTTSSEPAAIGRGAGRFLAAALTLAQLRRTVATLDLGAPLDGPLEAAHSDVQGDVLVALGRLGEVVEGDADRLYRVAFTLLAADDRAARAMGASA